MIGVDSRSPGRLMRDAASRRASDRAAPLCHRPGARVGVTRRIRRLHVRFLIDSRAVGRATTRFFWRFPCQLNDRCSSPPCRTSRRSCGSIPCAPPPRPAAAIRRPAARPPTSSPRSSSPRCASIRRTRTNPDSDRFVLSKGHAAPLLYAAWAEAGAFDRARAAEAAHDRVGPRGPSDAAAAVRRRRHRLARPGHLRGASASR